MTTTQNLHTHSTFCDGSSTMEEQVRSALRLGLTSLGFSSHAYTGYPFDDSGIKKDRIDAYFREIDRLQERYSMLTLYRGFEVESRRPYQDSRMQYAIGSCHFFATKEGLVPIDNTPDQFRHAIEVEGSVRTLLEGYFAEVVRFAREGSCPIIGHFDVVTKFNDKLHLFDDGKAWYRDLALAAIDQAAATGKIFEVNTGAIARGWKTEPYPARFLLARLHERHAPVLISSDCHDARFLTCRFAETEALLKSLGFTEQMRLTAEGFVAVQL